MQPGATEAEAMVALHSASAWNNFAGEVRLAVNRWESSLHTLHGSDVALIDMTLRRLTSEAKQVELFISQLVAQRSSPPQQVELFNIATPCTSPRVSAGGAS